MSLMGSGAYAISPEKAGRAVRHSLKSTLGNPWSLSVFLLAGAIVTPLCAILIVALGETVDIWPHLAETVLPRYFANTVMLMVGVAAGTLALGVGSAWLVSRYRFPGCEIFSWALLLPAAVPGYIIAYTYTDFLEYAGPVQGMLRDIFGWTSARDYWFPEIRSLAGASAMLAFVLYPYVYLTTRTAFRNTPSSLFEVCRLHGRSPFFSAALPMARPGIVAGLSLVMMETISDFGTVEYFAVETLTLGIFNTWLGLNSLPGAAKLSGVLFLFVMVLLTLEYYARRRQRFHETSSKHRYEVRLSANGWRAWGMTGLCAIPLVLGFVIPVTILLGFVLQGIEGFDYRAIGLAGWNSLRVAAAAVIVVVGTGLFFNLVIAYRGGAILRGLVFLGICGYAMPGAILAVGTVIVFTGIERGLGGPSLLVGGTLALVFAYAVRFMAVGYGSINAGMQRVPNRLMEAGLVLGRGFRSNIHRIVLPLLRGSLIAAALLVTVDVLKELPMTLLLRPFDFETLATYVYQFASDELLEESSLAALMIVAVGVGPMILLNKAASKVGRSAKRGRP